MLYSARGNRLYPGSKKKSLETTVPSPRQNPIEIKSNLKIKYMLIDWNPEDIDLATERFGTLNSERVTASAIRKNMREYIPKDIPINQLDAEQLAEQIKRDLSLPQDGVDIVINSGGLLNYSIAGNIEEAVLFNRIFSYLMTPDGGYGIYSGLTKLCIRATDHDENGMEIRNLYDEAQEVQMHVVRRPKAFVTNQEETVKT